MWETGRDEERREMLSGKSAHGHLRRRQIRKKHWAEMRRAHLNTIGYRHATRDVQAPMRSMRERKMQKTSTGIEHGSTKKTDWGIETQTRPARTDEVDEGEIDTKKKIMIVKGRTCDGHI